MPARVDILGKKFGKLLVVKENTRRVQGNLYWDCVCDCGKKVTVFSGSLRRNRTKSCGCYALEKAKKTFLTHGDCVGRKTKREYRIWMHIKNRCQNHKSPAYRHYGARGITICIRWKKFENFLKDMGRAPSKEHSVDRIDNEKGYYPENCRWATMSQQMRNRRDTVKVFYKGQMISLVDLCEIHGISHVAAKARFYRDTRGLDGKSKQRVARSFVDERMQDLLGRNGSSL